MSLKETETNERKNWRWLFRLSCSLIASTERHKNVATLNFLLLHRLRFRHHFSSTISLLAFSSGAAGRPNDVLFGKFIGIFSSFVSFIFYLFYRFTLTYRLIALPLNSISFLLLAFFFLGSILSFVWRSTILTINVEGERKKKKWKRFSSLLSRACHFRYNGEFFAMFILLTVFISFHYR